MQRLPPIVPAVLLGIGLGGFVDGIVLHQILQWHHLLTAEGCCPAATLGGLEDNTLADGLFHAFTWLVTLAGSLWALAAWRAGAPARPWRAQWGALLAGWGIFNLVDSLNHFVLGLHHVRDDIGGPASWDVGFLVFALVLIAVGSAAIRSAPRGGGTARAVPTR